MAFKASTPQQELGFSIENLLKAMFDLSLREGEIKTLKENLVERDIEITSLKEIVVKKYSLIL